MAVPFDIANFNLTNFADNYNNIFSSTPADVAISQKDNNGNIITKTVANRGKFKQQIWDDVNSALGQFNKVLYVDEINGDDTNAGSSSSPLKNIHTAFEKIVNSGKATVILLSDCSWTQDVTKYGIIVEIRLNGHKLQLVKNYSDNKAILFSLNGYGNTVYFYGENIDGSSVALPQLGDDTILSGGHSIFIKSNGSLEPELSSVHFGYGVELIDSGDFYISSCSSSTCSFSFSSDCTFTADTNKPRVITDLVSGVVRDVDSGNPVNLISNLNFSS